MPKPFFYRLNAADLFAHIRCLSKKDRSEWVLTFASDLVAGESVDEFTLKMIEEAKIFKKKKADAGKEGMKNRYKKG